MNSNNGEQESLVFFVTDPEEKTRQIEENLILQVETFFRHLNSGEITVQELAWVAPLLDAEELYRGAVLLENYTDTRLHFVQYYFAKLIYVNAHDRHLSSNCKETIKQICLSYCPSLLEELCVEQ